MAIPIPLIIAAASALGSLASTWKGTRDAAKQNKKSERLIQSEMAEAEAYRKALPKNYLDTLEGKAIVNQAAQALQQSSRAVNNNAIKTGATNEQRLAQMSNIQDAYNRILQNLATQSTKYNQYYDAIYRNTRNNSVKTQVGMNTQKAQSDVNSGIGIANAIGNLGTAAIQYYGTPAQTSDKKNVSNNVQTPNVTNPNTVATFNGNLYKIPTDLSTWKRKQNPTLYYNGLSGIEWLRNDLSKYRKGLVR